MLPDSGRHQALNPVSVNSATEFRELISSSGLLDQDGGLNDLGQRYIGAKTVHTQIITPAPTPTFTTVNGADNPSQGLVTSYTAVRNASARRWTLHRETIGLGMALAGIFIGAIWTSL